jgi:hypothetical protein
MPTLNERFGLTGAVISAVDLIRGIGKYAGLKPILVPGATGFLDTNYAGKVTAALDALTEMDLVFVHVEAPDEAGHSGELQLKLKAIEDFDAQVVGPMRAGLDKLGIIASYCSATTSRRLSCAPTPMSRAVHPLRLPTLGDRPRPYTEAAARCRPAPGPGGRPAAIAGTVEAIGKGPRTLTKSSGLPQLRAHTQVRPVHLYILFYRNSVCPSPLPEKRGRKTKPAPEYTYG